MTQLLRVIKKPPIDAVDFFLMLQEKSRIRAKEVRNLFHNTSQGSRSRGL
jgi:hypothetical protein